MVSFEKTTCVVKLTELRFGVEGNWPATLTLRSCAMITQVGPSSSHFSVRDFHTPCVLVPPVHFDDCELLLHRLRRQLWAPIG